MAEATFRSMEAGRVRGATGSAAAGAFYFLNEADIVICSDDATFFDSHVSHGFVSAIEPIGLMRRIGLGDTSPMRMAILATRSACARDRAAARVGQRGGRAARPLAAVRHELARLMVVRIRRRRRRVHVRAIWESLDMPLYRRLLAEQGLMYTGADQRRRCRGGRSHRCAPHHAEGSMSGLELPERLGAVMALDPAAPALEFGGRWYTWGDLACCGRSGRRRPCGRRASAPARRLASCCATAPQRSARSSGCCAPARASSP